MSAQNHFVLLDDTLKGADKAHGLLFSKPKTVLILAPDADASQVESFFDQLLCFSRQGFFLAGFFAYDFGFYLAKLKHPFAQFFKSKTAQNTQFSEPVRSLPLAQFGVFETKKLLNATQIMQFLDEVDAAHLNKTSAVRSLCYDPEFETYLHRFLRLQEELVSGNTYQTNLTINCLFEYNTSALSVYRALRLGSPVAYGAFLRLPDSDMTCTPDILSFSPELFVKKTDHRLVCKPIKGTLKRDNNPQQDQNNIEQLKTDPRFQAENVMIVDLIRNDLSQLAKTGSVRVDKLFAVESFSHLHHLVSEVSASLDEAKFKDQNLLFELMLALFPCGSITGAPKLNTMKIIDELEQRSRGVYTGAIGYIDACAPHQTTPDFCFNVAIRTLIDNPNQKTLTMGAGGGVLYQADAKQEFDEIKLKSAFVHNTNGAFELIETLKINQGIAAYLDLHLDRLQHSAQKLGFYFDRELIQKSLFQYIKQLDKPEHYVLRLSLSQQGQIMLADRAFTPPIGTPEGAPEKLPKVCVYPEPIDSRDWLRNYKTSARAHYERAHQYAIQRGCLDALLVNERGVITEASRWNVWLHNAQNQWVTSPVSEGLLGGVMRKVLLMDDSKLTIEQPIFLHDLLKTDPQSQALFLSNAVYGLVRVCLLNDE